MISRTWFLRLFVVGAGFAAALGAGLLVAGAQNSPDRRDAPAPPVAGRVYVQPGSELDYVVASAPLPAGQIGRIALAASERVREASSEAAEGGAETVDPPIFGAVPAGIPPPEWPLRVGGAEAKRGAADLAARPTGRTSCKCATEIGDTSKERVAVLYASRAFTVGEEISDLEVLRLRVRYRDGLIAYVNGREVARRNIDTGIPTMGVAARPRGPEWETFHVPVVPGLLGRGENYLALEVRPSGRRLAPSLDVELSAARGGRIVRGPVLQRVGPSSAMIQFDTDVPTSATVEYSTTAERGLVARSAGGGLAVHHTVTLEGLPESKPVHYRVLAGGDSSRELTFHTAPQPGDPIRFVAYGDVRGGHSTHRELVEAILSEAPDFAIATGDLVLRGSDEGDWQAFFAVAADLLGRIPLYTVAGNHDLGRSGAERRRMNEILALWPGPPDRPDWGNWHSFDVADLHFLMLDSNAYEYEEQLRWVREDLAAARARNVRAIFAVTHHSPYARGPHGGHRYAAEHYAPVLVAYGVTLLFAGHDHLYQRGRMNGLDYMVTGGGGAPLYKVRCGVPGRDRCRVEDGMQHAASEYHYVMVTVSRRSVKACPKRLDGTPLEKCVTYKLGKKRKRGH